VLRSGEHGSAILLSYATPVAIETRYDRAPSGWRASGRRRGARHETAGTREV